jgi:hypothetical protein
MPLLRGRAVPPLQLNDEEMTVLLTLARPIDRRLRDFPAVWQSQK